MYDKQRSKNVNNINGHHPMHQHNTNKYTTHNETFKHEYRDIVTHHIP